MKKGIVILIFVVIALLLAYYFIIYKKDKQQQVETKPGSPLDILQNQQVEPSSLPFPKPQK